MQKELRIEHKRNTDLNPAPYNPRTISEGAMSGLRASVERFGCAVSAHKQIGETDIPVVLGDLFRTDAEAQVPDELLRGA